MTVEMEQFLGALLFNVESAMQLFTPVYLMGQKRFHQIRKPLEKI